MWNVWRTQDPFYREEEEYYKKKVLGPWDAGRVTGYRLGRLNGYVASRNSYMSENGFG